MSSQSAADPRTNDVRDRRSQKFADVGSGCRLWAPCPSTCARAERKRTYGGVRSRLWSRGSPALLWPARRIPTCFGRSCCRR